MNNISKLTKREREVLSHLKSGKRNKEIANTLVITEATLESHLHSIYQKLVVSTRTEAAVYALRNEFSKNRGNPPG